MKFNGNSLTSIKAMIKAVNQNDLLSGENSEGEFLVFDVCDFGAGDVLEVTTYQSNHHLRQSYYNTETGLECTNYEGMW